MRTDGGSIEVRGDGDVLEVVDISTADGWEVQVDRPDDRQLVAVFTGLARTVGGDDRAHRPGDPDLDTRYELSTRRCR